MGLETDCRDPSIERFLHLNEEVPLFLAHALILFMRNQTKYHVPCKLVSMALQWLFLTHFGFMMAEAFQAYTISTSVIATQGYFNRKQFFVLGWVLPGIYTGLSGLGLNSRYVSAWSCWLNLGHGVAYATFVPLSLLAGTTMVMVEAGGMDAVNIFRDANLGQRKAAFSNQKGLLFVLPASVGSWFLGMYAVYEANVALYATVFGLNLSLAIAIFTFHTLGSPKVIELLAKFMPCLR